MDSHDARIALAIGAWVHKNSRVPREVKDIYKGRTFTDGSAQFEPGHRFNFRTSSPSHLIKGVSSSSRFYVEMDSQSSALLVEEQGSTSYRLTDLDNSITYRSEVSDDRVRLWQDKTAYEFELY